MTRINEAKVLRKHILCDCKYIFYAITNTSFIVKNVIQNKNGIMISVDVSAKSVMCAKKILLGILAHWLVRSVHI